MSHQALGILGEVRPDDIAAVESDHRCAKCGAEYKTARVVFDGRTIGPEQCRRCGAPLTILCQFVWDHGRIELQFRSEESRAWARENLAALEAMNERFFAEHMSRPVVLGRGISSGGHPNVVDLLKLAAAEIRRTFPECHFDVHGAWYEVEGRSVPYSQAL